MEVLTGPLFVNTVHQELSHCFHKNWGTYSSKGHDWEEMKVVIREICLWISYGVRRQIERDLCQRELQLLNIEKTFHVQPQRLEGWQQTRKDFSDDGRRLEKYTHMAYEWRLHAEKDKTGAMLPQLFKQQECQDLVLSPQDQSGALLHFQNVINDVFRALLSATYGICDARQGDCGKEFLGGIGLPRLSAEDLTTIADPTTREELWVAFKQLKSLKNDGRRWSHS
ncbi:hypothetical protein NDU88_009248 [Pleurodeles waltl]|uniref:Uncharacterized protein n=1 Tax=Pleurodeles waltl TaxID=8319 RepID=A0AAV7PSS4_PLEWA|nr:hypothetical protein NDU88_009248 [Pleurodeles waltl]